MNFDRHSRMLYKFDILFSEKALERSMRSPIHLVNFQAVPLTYLRKIRKASKCIEHSVSSICILPAF